MFTEYYHDASIQDKIYGLDWYTRAHHWCAATGARYGARTRTVAAILACTSQRVSWGFAKELTADAFNGLPVRHYSQVRDKVRRLLAGEDPWRVLRGQKIRAFWRAIMGDKRAVVLDTWMLRCGLGAPRASVKQYRNTAAILRAEARAAGLSPADFQAIIWCHVRGEYQ